DAQPGDGVEQGQLDQLNAQQPQAEGLVGQQAAALAPQLVELFSPAGPPLLPGFGLGQKVHGPDHQPLNPGAGADQNQSQDDGGHHRTGGQEVLGRLTGAAQKPFHLEKQQTQPV